MKLSRNDVANAVVISELAIKLSVSPNIIEQLIAYYINGSSIQQIIMNKYSKLEFESLISKMGIEELAKELDTSKSTISRIKQLYKINISRSKPKKIIALMCKFKKRRITASA